MLFDEQAFQSWPFVIAGALCFAALFACAALLAERLFGGTFRITWSVAGFAVAAFIGFIATALILRRDGTAGKGGPS